MPLPQLQFPVRSGLLRSLPVPIGSQQNRQALKECPKVTAFFSFYLLLPAPVSIWHLPVPVWIAGFSSVFLSPAEDFFLHCGSSRHFLHCRSPPPVAFLPQNIRKVPLTVCSLPLTGHFFLSRFPGSQVLVPQHIFLPAWHCPPWENYLLTAPVLPLSGNRFPLPCGQKSPDCRRLFFRVIPPLSVSRR